MKVHVISPNTFLNPGKVASVMEEMKRLGPPTIRAVRVDDKLLAIEGSHRLAAAQTFGAPVKLVIVRDWRCLRNVGMESYLSLIEGMIKAGISDNLVSFDVDVEIQQEASA